MLLDVCIIPSSGMPANATPSGSQHTCDAIRKSGTRLMTGGPAGRFIRRPCQCALAADNAVLITI